MANFNTLVRRFENGGVVTVGSDTLLNIVPGSMNFTPPMRERVEYKDRGVQQTPLLGDDMYGEFTIRTRGPMGTHTAVKSAYTQFFTATGTTNPDVFTFVIKVPDDRAAATGDSLTLTGWYLSEPPKLVYAGSGDSLDEYEFKFKGTATTGPVTY